VAIIDSADGPAHHEPREPFGTCPRKRIEPIVKLLSEGDSEYLHYVMERYL
jgi:hypothetical protein